MLVDSKQITQHSYIPRDLRMSTLVQFKGSWIHGSLLLESDTQAHTVNHKLQ